ncbi:hypothetical protein L596_015196 [Steinernema carpocapsae]|uniref:Saposin B-type domain-containing protein n=1 Tax=Steinernema carpocapsae TaxID=34508 RepID=A0A4U5NF59_STECR|nr:hypothetical protein L596_015196 [Steinernema carpocapsae]
MFQNSPDRRHLRRANLFLSNAAPIVVLRLPAFPRVSLFSSAYRSSPAALFDHLRCHRSVNDVSPITNRSHSYVCRYGFTCQSYHVFVCCTMATRMTVALCLLFVVLFLALCEKSFQNEYLEKFSVKTEVVNSICDVCIVVVRGLVYDLVHFKILLEKQIEKRCHRYFHYDESLERHCVELFNTEVIRLLDRLEMRMNPNKICSKFQFCSDRLFFQLFNASQ